MKYLAAIVVLSVLSVLGACSRQAPDAGYGTGSVDSGRTPDTVADSSREPPEDAAPTELAVQQAHEDAAELSEDDAANGPASGDATNPPSQQPSEQPQTMK